MAKKAVQCLMSLFRLRKSIKYLSSYQTFLYSTRNKMSDIDTPNSLLDRVRQSVPELNTTRHKGQAGRIGIVGGSLEYTGAPYFAAISALRTGADLVHVFCAQSAATVIKSYSPELIVHPILDAKNAIDQIEPWLERIHVLVIGPGLGKDSSVLETVTQLINVCRKLEKPLVIDADGLHLVTENPSLIKDYNGAILTPNAIEFSRLFGNDRDKIQETVQSLGAGLTVLEKGVVDIIYETTTGTSFTCPTGGSGRRCGGQGDLLSGAIATFYNWTRESKDPSPAKVACFAACQLIKNCNRSAFAVKGRSTVASDMIEFIHPIFDKLFEIRRRNQTSV